ILSPGNRAGELVRKFRFYERYGVEEYYVYNPDDGELIGYLCEGSELREVPSMAGWTSPRLKVRFESVKGELHLFGPDGRRFATYLELAEQHDRAQREMEQQTQALEQLRAQLRELGAEPRS